MHIVVVVEVMIHHSLRCLRLPLSLHLGHRQKQCPGLTSLRSDSLRLRQNLGLLHHPILVLLVPSERTLDFLISWCWCQAEASQVRSSIKILSTLERLWEFCSFNRYVFVPVCLQLLKYLELYIFTPKRKRKVKIDLTDICFFRGAPFVVDSVMQHLH